MNEYLLNRLDRECAQISTRSRKGEELKREVANAIDSAVQNAADTCLEKGLKRDTKRWNAMDIANCMVPAPMSRHCAKKSKPPSK